MNKKLLLNMLLFFFAIVWAGAGVAALFGITFNKYAIAVGFFCSALGTFDQIERID